MDSSPKTLLISIHPQYVNLLFEKTKKIEFRKTDFQKNFNKVLIYCTYPTCRIVGFFTVKKVIKLTPLEMWEKYKNIGGIEKEVFFNYYQNKKLAIGILVDKIYMFKNVLDLKDFNISVPQSYQYLNSYESEEICLKGEAIN